MSASRMATRAPSFCSASARLTAVVDLPTPPLAGGDHQDVANALHRRELLGAIVYLAGVVVYEDNKNADAESK